MLEGTCYIFPLIGMDFYIHFSIHGIAHTSPGAVVGMEFFFFDCVPDIADCKHLM